jgi:hypothetical protein
MKNLKYIQTLAAALATIILTGCGTPKVWYSSEKSFQQTRQDLAACRAEADRITNPLAPLNLSFSNANEDNKKDFINNCMIAKGYSLVETNSLPAGVAGVPSK